MLTDLLQESTFKDWNDRFFQADPSPLAVHYWTACQVELLALKPGNVHLYADGHGMTVDHFLASAYATASKLTDSKLSLGERALQSVIATRDAVSMNTNLGMILLCAPLAIAAEKASVSTLQQTVDDVIRESDVQEAELIFQAIRMAAPSGLSTAKVNDVWERARQGIYAIMKSAEANDMIARQYVTEFADVFEVGLNEVDEGVAQNLNQRDLALRIYLGFLSRFPDTHIVRQYGSAVAENIRSEANSLYAEFCKLNSTQLMYDRLMDYDENWKSREVNPGTSADLTVATLFAYQIKNAVN
ncbi:MAG: triphosphoribosyl-dephospho-CoA synthase [Gammaproteobacteria bacterium]|nr:triphosphoribosyl-dephospho-CoA synthase [Gammaproteobacteria bacterium]